MEKPVITNLERGAENNTTLQGMLSSQTKVMVKYNDNVLNTSYNTWDNDFLETVHMGVKGVTVRATNQDSQASFFSLKKKRES